MELTASIDRSVETLLHAYEPEALYAFRVNSRRIRSILKHMESHRARSLRKAWGGFAAVTNDARDWDVFLATAKLLLDARDYEVFRKLNSDRVDSAHDTVIEMLGTSHWSRYLVQWREFLAAVDEQASDADGSRDALAAALRRVLEARKTALEVNDDPSWHRFRISVKELRYVADALGDEDELVDACKKLQTLLGDWHDTVVQLNLLEELPPDPVHERLASIIRGRKAEFLTMTRQLLDGHPIFDPGEGTGR